MGQEQVEMSIMELGQMVLSWLRNFSLLCDHPNLMRPSIECKNKNQELWF